MSATQLLLLGAAVGHGLLMILALNVSHGFGFNHKSLDRMVLATLALAGCAAAGDGRDDVGTALGWLACLD